MLSADPRRLAPGASVPLARGTPAYRRLTLAMLFAGFSTFSLLYAAQPLLPEFAGAFHLSAEAASLAVSLATGPLALGILVSGAVSDRVGRRGIMIWAMFLASVFGGAAAIAPGWRALLFCRVLTGVALSGVPAVAMAYVSEEVDAESVGAAMGLYIAGSALGGMGGRLAASLVATIADWRWALGVVALAGLVMAEAFRRLAPPSRGFARASGGGGSLFRDAALPWLYLEAFVLMGVFITVYNYAAFRLEARPYGLSRAAVGAVFLLYLLGSASSAWFGAAAGVRGRGRVFPVPVLLLVGGVLLTAARPLGVVVLGIAVVTIGFFGAHSIASAWVGQRAGATKGRAAALYLFFYYLGSSVLGSAGGVAWTWRQWPGVTGYCCALGTLALTGAAALARVRPTTPP